MTVEIDGANNTVKTNTISEVTSANGVTVDGLSIKDSKLVTANSVVEANITNGAVTSSKIASGVIPSFRPNAQPLIINGDMAVAQRGTSATGLGSGGGGYKTVDRWRFSKSGTLTAEFTMSQSTDVPSGQGFAKSLKLDCTTAQGSLSSNNNLILEQKFEGQDLQLFKKGTSNAEKFTLAFWVKSNKTGTSQVNLNDNDNSRLISATYTISSANTWEHKVLNYASDTTGAFNDDNASSLQIEWFLDSGTDFSSGTAPTSWEALANTDRNANNLALADSTSNELYITGVQLEVGEYTSATIPPFQFETVGDNLARCQRYYYHHASGDNKVVCMGSYYTANNLQSTVFFPVSMRSVPTADFTMGTGFITLHRNGAGDEINDLTVEKGTVNAVDLTADNSDGVSGTAGFATRVKTSNASTVVAFTAEL